MSASSLQDSTMPEVQPNDDAIREAFRKAAAEYVARSLVTGFAQGTLRHVHEQLDTAHKLAHSALSQARKDRDRG